MTKARHGDGAGDEPSTTLRSRCLLVDFYAGDWIDRLDELKTNIDERQVLAHAGAFALGRKTDELIIDACSARRPDTPATAATGLTKAKVLQAFEELGAADVPDDGQRFAVIGWKQWSDLLDLQEFASAEFVGDDQLPWRGTQAKRWLGTLWLPHSGLPLSGRRPALLLVPQAAPSAMPSARRSPATSPGTATAPRTSSPTRCRQGAGLIDASRRRQAALPGELTPLSATHPVSHLPGVFSWPSSPRT